MRVLYLTNKPIYPLVDGGCKAMDSFLTCLRENKWEIEHLCISTEKHPFSASAYPAELQEKIKVNSVFLSTKLNPLHAALALLKGNSYTISRFQSNQLCSGIDNILTSTKFDLVILESLFSSTCLSVLTNHKGLKVVLRSHNVEHKLWEEKSIKTSNPFKKWYFSLLSKQLKKYEIETLQQVDGIATLSELDLQEFKQLGIRTPIWTIPVALPKLAPRQDYTPSTFFFIGSMNWQPNLEAVHNLTDVIFPIIQQEIPNAKLVIAGSFMNERLLSHHQKNVEIIGFVNDLNDFFNTNGILLSPISSGSGVRVKLLEAMNMGTPIVSSHKGAKGINMEDQLILEDNPNDFAQKAVKLYRDSNLRAELGAKAFEFAQRNYSTTSIAKTIREFINTL